MANKLKSKQVFHLLCTFLLVFLVLSVNVLSDIIDDQRGVAPESKTTAFWVSKVKQSGNDYWNKLKESFAHGHSYFFPPSIDFSGKDDDVAAMGAGEKLKEAAAKSFDKSKETVEETAKSAAEAVGDAAGAVKKKVKKSVSTKTEESTSEL